MDPSSRKQRSARIHTLMWNLRIDSAIGEVVQALRASGIESLVLKGPTFADWYPPDSPRTYVDGDVLVPPALVAGAEDVLTSLGFAPTRDERGVPDWWQEHASSWLRSSDGGKIDLHRKLQATSAPPEAVWTSLWKRREAITVGGASVWRLSEPGRALYATLHATHHGSVDRRGLPHLQAALQAVDDEGWTAALSLAIELNAVEAFATGLRLLPAGAELVSRIGVPDARSVKTSLLASTPPPVALGFDQLAGASGRQRAEILLRKLLPPPGFIRYWWPPAARSRRMLAVGYLYRPVWLAKHVPAGYRAWRAARRDASNSS
ncbi:MAG: nucleotidyltransferase family protein [Solirubrobacteraceae bacterium]